MVVARMYSHSSRVATARNCSCLLILRGPGPPAHPPGWLPPVRNPLLWIRLVNSTSRTFRPIWEVDGVEFTAVTTLVTSAEDLREAP